MTKHSFCSVRPTLEALEDRCTPAGTVTGSLTSGVWRLTGDNAANVISVAAAGKPGAFTVTGDATTVAGVTSPKGVHKIVFDMKGDNDSVTVNLARLSSMVFNGGDGNNAFNAQRFALADGLRVSNGVGNDQVQLRNLKIGGHVNIGNSSGGSSVQIGTLSAAAGFNKITGNVNITNGAGVDFTGIVDTDVGGSIMASNGAGGGSDAGGFAILNVRQTARRAIIGGNVTVTWHDGFIDYNGISDAVMRGNVLFNNGSGPAFTVFDGHATNSPVVIEGRLKIAGTGINQVIIGRFDKKTGLRVGQHLIIDVKNPTDLTLQPFNLFVAGQTKIV